MPLTCYFSGGDGIRTREPLDCQVHGPQRCANGYLTRSVVSVDAKVICSTLLTSEATLDSGHRALRPTCYWSNKPVLT